MSKSGKAPDYDQLNQELAELMERLSGGNMDIDEAVSCYERALQIIGTLKDQVLAAEHRVRQLKAAADIGPAAGSGTSSAESGDVA